ncbi:VOC family protein [Rhizobium sp. LC145]|uniref:VOC family protein n=1 Tax=Rhizobium sp. LC145 TaxID=1120688 RepID=UPI000629F612|nr:VOC family protein [Rhizobium sp. LC145]KKX33672.1 lactoylglutathione lyase [Rhizobium sp. LC145]TKT55364.1 VOC family protein [Rhizobiaceae bacterium LC148]
MNSPRPIDHLVLPVSNLAAARSRLSELGFTVAPDADHPFGTRNACVFLPDGSYLEPLGVANRRQASGTAKRGNVFTAHDLEFRGGGHREGLSALVVASTDAAADEARFRRHGISRGEMLHFSRPVTLPDGSVSEASFRLAFAADERAPDFLLFAAERVNPLPANRGDLERHANHVLGFSEIVLSAPAPSDFAAMLETVMETQAEAEAESGAVRIQASNCAVRIAPDGELEPEFALAPDDAPSGLHGRAIIFRVADLAVTEITLAANDVAFIRKAGRVLVAAAPGQGVLFGFEE